MAVHVINDLPDDEENLLVKDEPALTAAPAQAPEEKPEPADEIPEKYKGKSAAEIAKMHSELEHRLGAQGSELGELRRTLDLAIQASLVGKQATQTPEAPTTETSDDSEYFTNPRKAVEKAVEQHPLVKELREKSAQTQQERNKAMFLQKHPDAAEIAKDPEFHEYIKASKVRQALFVAADKGYDVDAADELFSTFKAIKGVKAPTPAPAPADKGDPIREAELRAAGVPSGNSAPMEAQGSKPIYKRRQLIELRMTNPAKYDAMSDEITLAYAEGRVRG
jgi:hypothetical protein